MFWKWVIWFTIIGILFLLQRTYDGSCVLVYHKTRYKSAATRDLVLKALIVILTYFFAVFIIKVVLLSYFILIKLIFYLLLIHLIFSLLLIVFILKFLKELILLELLHQSFNISNFISNLLQILWNPYMVLKLAELSILHSFFPHIFDLFEINVIFLIFRVNFNGSGYRFPFLFIRKRCRINFPRNPLFTFFSISLELHILNLILKSYPSVNQEIYLFIVISFFHLDFL